MNANSTTVNSACSETFVQRWHQLLASKSAAELDALLADDATMVSPVVFTPQVGKDITKMYLTAALHVFVNEHFHYKRELTNANTAFLEFETEINGVYINGVDMISLDDEGKIKEFKVMLRPLQAVNMVHEMMGQMLKKL